MEIDPEMIVPDKTKSIIQGAILPLGEQPRGNWYGSVLKSLSEKYNLKAAMINPAVWAYKIFKNDMGSNENLNTGEKYFIDDLWVQSLKDIFIENMTGKNYLVLLQTGDQTLNYKFAKQYFEGSNIIIDEGGSHSFENLELKIPEMLLHFS